MAVLDWLWSRWQRLAAVELKSVRFSDCVSQHTFLQESPPAENLKRRTARSASCARREQGGSRVWVGVGVSQSWPWGYGTPALAGRGATQSWLDGVPQSWPRGGRYQSPGWGTLLPAPTPEGTWDQRWGYPSPHHITEGTWDQGLGYPSPHPILGPETGDPSPSPERTWDQRLGTLPQKGPGTINSKLPTLVNRWTNWKYYLPVVLRTWVVIKSTKLHHRLLTFPNSVGGNNAKVKLIFTNGIKCVRSSDVTCKIEFW